MIVKEQLTQLVKEMANRMKNPQEVNQIFFHPDNRNNDPLFPERSNYQLEDFHLIDEYTGVLLLLAELDRLFPDEKWDLAIHDYILKIKEILESKRFIHTSLFGGLTGVAFALQKASREGTRYQKMITVLNNHLLESVKKHYLDPLEENLNTRQFSSFSLYDVIQGIAGIGIYGLINFHLPSFAELVKHILILLVKLVKPVRIEERWIPGWYLPQSLHVYKEEQQKYPQGNFNLGHAHGIPGVLAFLSIALIHRVEVPGQREAIGTIVDWLKKHRQENQGNFFWRTVIPFEEEMEQIKTKENLTKDAWCYGTPGVARSLFLAGKALENEELKSYAFDSFCSVFNRNRHEWDLLGPTFCHGYSGLLMITRIMAQETQSSFLNKQVELLKEIVLEYYHQDHSFGFTSLEPCQKGGFIEISRLSLLEGASGILLTLLSLEGLTSWWHAPFLIGDGTDLFGN